MLFVLICTVCMCMYSAVCIMYCMYVLSVIIFKSDVQIYMKNQLSLWLC